MEVIKVNKLRLIMLAEGLTQKKLGKMANISAGTVKTHTAHIYGKLNVHNRVQAVARATGLGIL